MNMALGVLAGLAAALAGVVGWELWPSEGAAPLPVLPAFQPVEARAAVAGDVDGWVAKALARPLFSPDRRPAAAGATSGGAGQAWPRLTGTLVSGAGRGAIFAGPRPIVVREGGRLDGFTVQLIEPGRVTVRGPDGVRVLRPTFDPAAPGGAGVPAEAGAAVGAGPGVVAGGAATLSLPGARPVVGGEGPPIPGASPTPADAPQGSMPFDQIRAPSGLDIIRNEAQRGAGSPGR